MTRISDAVLNLAKDMHTMQENISRLSLSFAEQISYINITLITKADQHDVDILTEKVATIYTATMGKTALEALRTLHSLAEVLTRSKINLTSMASEFISKIVPTSWRALT